MRVLGGCSRVLVRGPTLVMRGVGVGLRCLRIMLVVFSDCLKMVVGGGNVTGCGQMMMLARHVAFGVRHDISFR